MKKKRSFSHPTWTGWLVRFPGSRSKLHHGFKEVEANALDFKQKGLMFLTV